MALLLLGLQTEMYLESQDLLTSVTLIILDWLILVKRLERMLLTIMTINRMVTTMLTSALI